MAAIELRKPVMAGPMRWIALSVDGRVSTLAWFVKVCYTVHGCGTVLFVRCDLDGCGGDDLFAVFGDNLAVARHLRDEIFSYTAFAGVPGQSPPAPIIEASFESRGDYPDPIVESMRAADGTTLTLSFRDFGRPAAYVRSVSERLTEVGAYAQPREFALEIKGVPPAGRPEAGPLAEAPPMGADLQNLWFESAAPGSVAGK